jgi:hypothetical protein
MDRTEEAVRFPARVVVDGGKDGDEAAIFAFQGAKLRTAGEVRAKQESGTWIRYSLAEIFLLPPRFGTFHTPVRLGSLSSADTR